MTEQQINWASRHDWFVGRNGDSIVVADRWLDAATRELHEVVMPWTLSFRELRLWAGY